jgi:DNA polymerase-1
VAVAIDVSGDRGTFRSELYPQYKATRDPPPEDLFPQIDRCLAILEAVGMPVLGAEAFEADDVIATVVRPGDRGRGRAGADRVEGQGPASSCSSAGRVEMYDVHTDDLIDAARLLEDKGVSPGQVIDMLALMGDTVDNVPGVPGIGPKTAAQLIAEYGYAGRVLAEASKEKSTIKGKRRENMLATADALPLSKELVTLRHDAPVELDLERAAVSTLDLAALEPILRSWASTGTRTS